MKDKDIIKALEWKISTFGDEVCFVYVDEDECKRVNVKDALDLIDHQQAEIKRLEIDLEAMRGSANSYKMHYETAKSEAVKEFAERLKAKCHNYYPSIDSYCASVKAVGFKDIDNLVEEMVGVKEMVGED